MIKRLSRKHVSIDSRKCITETGTAPKKHKKAVHILLAFNLIAITVSGIALHIAGHGTDHEVWHNLAVTHVLLSIMFAICSAQHIRRYVRLYKSFGKVRTAIRNVDIAAVSLFMSIATITGIVLLFWDCTPNTGMSLWHYWFGMLMSLVTAIHIIRRKRR